MSDQPTREQRIAEAIGATREFLPGVVFGVPEDGREQYLSALAKAAASVPADQPVRLYGAPSVDDDIANHDLVLKWWDHDRPGVVAAEARIPVEQVAAFLRDATNLGLRAMTGAAEALQYGECAECSNSRMVDVPRSGGRTERVHCPTCRPEGLRVTALKDAPVVGPKVKPGFGREGR